MAITQTTRIARELAGPRATIFNDRMVDGRRSLKVWGWKLHDYRECQRLLEAAGHKVEMIERNAPQTYFRAAGKQIRLHVTEN